MGYRFLSFINRYLIEILSIILLATLIFDVFELVFLKKEITNNLNFQADSIAKRVDKSIIESKLASKTMEHQIDLRMVSYLQNIGDLLVDKNENQITNDQLETIRKKLGLSGITILAERNDDIVGVKSTDLKEIGFGFRQFQNGGYELLESLLKGRVNQTLPVSFINNEAAVTPIVQSGSHSDQPVFFKYGYYHPPHSSYLVNAYMNANEVLQYTKEVDPEQEIKKLKDENPFINEIAVLNPLVFQDPTLERQLYPTLRKVDYGSFNDINVDDNSWLEHYNGNVQGPSYSYKNTGKKLFKIFFPTSNDQVIYVALNYDKMKDPIDQHFYILMIMTILSFIVFLILAYKCFLKTEETKSKLWRSNQILLSIIQNSPLGIIVSNKDNQIMVWNKSAESIFGWTEGEVLGNSNVSIPIEEEKKYLEKIRSLQRGEPCHFELICKNKSQVPIMTSCAMAPLFDASNHFIGYVSIQQDITNRKKMEDKLLQSEKLTVLSELSAAVAHEIRNPLASIRGFVQLMQEVSGEHKSYLDIMRSEIDRINDIVSEFMNLAKPQAHHFYRKDAQGILQQTLPLFNSLANFNNIQISTDFIDKPLIVDCIEHQLKQVFINIIKNSIEAMKNQGRLQISATKTEDDKILIRFKDNGAGIPEERLEKLGEPFFTTKEKGSGLGLMVCYKIVHTHQGSIHISSQTGVGTTVDIVLPLAN